MRRHKIWFRFWIRWTHCTGSLYFQSRECHLHYQAQLLSLLLKLKKHIITIFSWTIGKVLSWNLRIIHHQQQHLQQRCKILEPNLGRHCYCDLDMLYRWRHHSMSCQNVHIHQSEPQNRQRNSTLHLHQGHCEHSCCAVITGNKLLTLLIRKKVPKFDNHKSVKFFLNWP